MGKLAERLADAQRSGVYRLESTQALEEAAALNGFALARIALEGMPRSALCGIAADVLSRRSDGQVLLFSGGEALSRAAPDALDRLIAQIHAAATAHREVGLRFFAAFLDPAAALSLAPLYHWQRSAAVRAA
ncbi:MAG: hypothetical protein IH606_12175 [Burkholderiales bacterium]|nr:hypothetical protein [Burkholderiales bacterium]